MLARLTDSNVENQLRTLLRTQSLHGIDPGSAARGQPCRQKYDCDKDQQSAEGDTHLQGRGVIEKTSDKAGCDRDQWCAGQCPDRQRGNRVPQNESKNAQAAGSDRKADADFRSALVNPLCQHTEDTGTAQQQCKAAKIPLSRATRRSLPMDSSTCSEKGKKIMYPVVGANRASAARQAVMASPPLRLRIKKTRLLEKPPAPTEGLTDRKQWKNQIS